MLKDQILKTDMERRYLEQLRETLTREKNITAWGTGRGAKKLLQFIRIIGWSGKLQFIDSNEDKSNELYEGYLTVTPNTFFGESYDPDTCIVITCADVGGGATYNSKFYQSF